MRARSGADSHEQQIFKERKTKLLQPAQRQALPARAGFGRKCSRTNRAKGAESPEGRAAPALVRVHAMLGAVLQMPLTFGLGFECAMNLYFNADTDNFTKISFLHCNFVT
jgi:hypothetical protein